MNAYLTSHALEIFVVLIALVAATFALLDAYRSGKLEPRHVSLKGIWVPSSNAQADGRARRQAKGHARHAVTIEVMTEHAATSSAPQVRSRRPATSARLEES